MRITKISDISSNVNTREIDIDPWDYELFLDGKLGFVQDAFPGLSADDREFLLTGITPEEWDEYIGEEIEEDEENDYTGYGLAYSENDETGVTPEDRDWPF